MVEAGFRFSLSFKLSHFWVFKTTWNVLFIPYHVTILLQNEQDCLSTDVQQWFSKNGTGTQAFSQGQQHQNHFYNNAKTLFAPFTFIFSWDPMEATRLVILQQTESTTKYENPVLFFQAMYFWKNVKQCHSSIVFCLEIVISHKNVSCLSAVVLYCS